MLKKYTLILFALCFSGLAMSQGNRDKKNDKREKIKAEKIGFISTELELSPEEAQAFWPIYNLYETEIDNIRKERRTHMKQLKSVDDLSDEKSFELSKLIFETEKKESDIRLNYLNQFSKVLNKKKAVKVFIAEEKFKRELLKKLKGNGPPPRH